MSAQDAPPPGATCVGGRHGSGSASTFVSGDDASGRNTAASIVAQGSAAEGPCGERAASRPAVRTAAGPWLDHPDWPAWAAVQLRHALSIAAATPPGESVAAHLYRTWFNYPLGLLDGCPPVRYAMPLAGVYRAAHAGSARRIELDGVQLVNRHDLVRADGWWRTWGRSWVPPRRRPGAARILLSPAPDRLARVVRTLTGALLDRAEPWSLACPTNPRRIRRCAAVILELPAIEMLSGKLLAALEPDLRPEIPPLCLPLGIGVALSTSAANGMTFGEQRCRLISLALRRPDAREDPLGAIAEVFRAHAIDPAQPYRYAG